ncbi:MAG: phage head-tail connector protein [Erysipelotrichaceae bacterium]|nr:phage head-tail connector protein [Erysipelotrichaceae bacterium]
MLETLKLYLGIEANDEDKNSLLSSIVSDATARLKLLLGGIEPPEEMNYIIKEVSIIRYNRIGSEGVTIHSVEGESMHFSDNDFAAYSEEIQSWLDRQNESKRGKVRFL